MKLLTAIFIVAFAGTALSLNPKQDLRSLYTIIISYNDIMLPHLKYDRTINDIHNPDVEAVLLGLIADLYAGLRAAINLVDKTETQNAGSISRACNWAGIKSDWAGFTGLLTDYETNPPQDMTDKQGRIDKALDYIRNMRSLATNCKIF